ncbi:MAG: class I SAM-dependent rRNA methyltransferase [Candidatus Marinimicrobia bacterium]|nr:class I SAM-dependent rRNA methyltransferase [Candidatus Neomarinimicrobiota bacterium]MCF7839299.1 class I SAM-dependent rRNA methyltransferase [Candidatus Neomarinimicrobiota bacterium]MCF7903085.1 class I SAM-dependent rRNA methyltransferase [Candidatus Neomarinimicrobiota bacterium]
MIKVHLKPKAAVQARHFHPWVFSQGIAQMSGEPQSGETVQVLDESGQFLAYAHFSPQSKIALRLVSWDESDSIDRQWYEHQMDRAIHLRFPDGKLQPHVARRLIFSESDQLPGFILDAFGNYLVMQILSAGMERVLDILVQHLLAQYQPAGILERSDLEVRKLEGLDPRVMWHHGTDPGQIMIQEGETRFMLQPDESQKTGFYLDQAQNRHAVARYCQDKSVLDAFCYTGGFGLHALNAQATSVRFLDTSQPALEMLKQNLALNDIDESRVAIDEGDVFQALRTYRDAARSFDVIILDPPKFAPTRATLKHAERAYKDINLWAMKLVNRDGILVTFSCSGSLSREHFQRILHYAALDAGRDVQILEQLGQAPDHPIRLAFPESRYLKGFILRVR